MEITYIAYCRKSSEKEDQQTRSIESQKDELTALANKLDIKIENFYTEAHSAKNPGKRVVFNELVTKISKEGSIILLVWHPDRLSRNSIEMASIIHLMDTEKLIEVVTPSQIFRNLPIDKFMLGFEMLQAKLNNDNKGINVKRGLVKKARDGYLPSGAKPGYMNDKYEEKGNKKIKRDPTRFLLVKNALKLVSSGDKTPMESFRILNNDWGYTTPKKKKIGGKPMARSRWYETLSDPFYYGEFEFPIGSGNFYQGKHPPMISKEEFDLIQLRLGKRGRKRSKKNFTYSGTMNCGECNAFITADEKWQMICSECKNKFACNNKDTCTKCNKLIEEMDNPKILHYIYYHCTKRKDLNCSQGAIEVKKLEKMIDQTLARIEIPKQFVDWAIKNLHQISEYESQIHEKVILANQAKVEDLKKRLSNLVSLKISPLNSDGSLLTDEEFKLQKEIITKEIRKIEKKLDSTRKDAGKYLKLSEDTFNFAHYARYHFNNGNPKTKQEIFERLGSNLEIFDKLLRVELKKPLKYIEESLSVEPSILDMLEPNKNSDLSRNYESVWDSNPSLLAVWDDFRTAIVNESTTDYKIYLS